MDSIIAALGLAGFVLAHAMDMLSQPQTPDLTPVAFVARGNDQQFITFQGATVEEMLERGKQQLTEGSYDAWALAYEGFVVVENEKRHALFVHSWMRGMDSPIVIAQEWARADDGVHAEYLGPAILLPASHAPKGGQRLNVDPIALTEGQLRALAAGMDEYEKLSEKAQAQTR